MESGGVPIRQWVMERFESMDARIRSNHDTIRELRSSKETDGRKLVRIEEQLKDLGNDMAEMKSTMKWILRGIIGAIGVGLMFVVAVASLIVQAAG